MLPDVHRLVNYPFTGTGAVSITRGDRARLEHDQFLNDTLIEYGLKCVLPAQSRLTHAGGSWTSSRSAARPSTLESMSSTRSSTRN